MNLSPYVLPTVLIQRRSREQKIYFEAIQDASF
jgi:hypothetical protein